MGFNGVMWMSKKQPTIIFSSTKIEYCVMSKGVKESWLQRLVKDFGVFDYEPIPIFFVNQSSIKLAQNLVFHIKTKHIKIYYHFIREKMLNGEIGSNQIPTKNQVVDILTKSLSYCKFEYLKTELGVTSLQFLLGGKLKI